MKVALAAGVTVLLAAIGLPALAVAQPVQFVISGATHGDSDGGTTIEILLINNENSDQSVALPDQIEGVLTSATTRSIQLKRAPGEQPAISVPARGFARARYRAMVPAGSLQANDLISIPTWGTQQVAMAASPAVSPETQARVEPKQDAEPKIASEATAASREGTIGESLLRNLSVHEPIYAIFGTTSQSEIKIQGSFKYRLFGSSRPPSRAHEWRDGLYFAFTQKMFWDLASDSSFRDVNYTPELFYRTPSISLADTLEAGLEAGIQHESNGKAGPDSRSVNTVYVAPTAMWNLGNDYNLTVSPRLTMLVGGRADNPDIKSYRGITGLKFQIGQADGLRLSATGRYNFSTGRGAVLTELSYPLQRLFGGGPELYLFGQNFTGYGESLLDYNRRMTRLRFGLAVVR